MNARHWGGTVLLAGAAVVVGGVPVLRFAGAVDGTGADAPVVSSSASGSGSGTGSSSGSDTSVNDGCVPDTTTRGTTTPDVTSPTTTAPGTASSSVTITGDAVGTRYGDVQVAVTFTGTHIDSVVTVLAPTGRESTQISARSTPVLADEVVTAQSAQIDTVSGATYTSEGYRQSVQSAIDQLG